MLFSAQIRAARAILKMKQSDLALEAGLSEKTIKILENDDEAIENANLKTLRKLKTALEEKGIKFLPASEKNEAGPGLRYSLDFKKNE